MAGSMPVTDVAYFLSVLHENDSGGGWLTCSAGAARFGCEIKSGRFPRKICPGSEING